MDRYGQVAYEGYASAVNWQAVDGSPLPRWEDLPEPRLLGAWEAAATAVVQRYAQDVDKESDQMTRQVPMDQPLSEEDRDYLHARGEHARVEQLDEQFPPEDGVADDGEPDRDYEKWTMSELEDEVKFRNGSGAGITLPPKAKKQDLVAALQANDGSPL